MGIYAHGEYIRKVLTDIYNGPKGFHVPYELKDGTDNVWLNKMIAEFSLGDKGDLNCVIIKDAFIEFFELNDTFKLPELHVKAITERGNEEIVVGAYAIRENMAYLLERRCTTKYKSSKDFPYQIVEILANYKCPGKLNDLELIALCDVALQCSSPGHGLYILLEGIANGNLTVNKAEDLYDFYYSQNTTFLGVNGSVSQALITAASMAMDHLLTYVKVEELNEEFQQWIVFIFSAGVAMRIQKPYFFLEMARGKRNRDNAVLQYLTKNIGSPQMVNAMGKRFQLATERPVCRFEYLEAVKEIERLFECGESKCSLKSWCEMSPDGAPANNSCDKVPWTRCNDKNMCPYGMLWRHWKLSDFKPVI